MACLGIRSFHCSAPVATSFALLSLRVTHVLKHLAIETLGVEEKRRRACGQTRITSPRILFIYRRVSDDPVHVVLNGPRRVVVNTIECGVARFKAGRCERVNYEPVESVRQSQKRSSRSGSPFGALS